MTNRNFKIEYVNEKQRLFFAMSQKNINFAKCMK